METSLVNRADEIIKAISIPTESIANLLYLIEHNRHDAGKVLEFARGADEQIRCVVEVIESFRRQS